MECTIYDLHNHVIATGEADSYKDFIVKNKTDLHEADLHGADLRGADLREADLHWADLQFKNFPSISFLCSIHLRELSDTLSLELMRRDAYAHPNPERFDVWADGGNCPYEREDRFWMFNVKRSVWKPGPPQMADRDLIVSICREKGWKIVNNT